MKNILPRDIQWKDHLWNTFGSYETELSAQWLINYCQINNNWDSFQLEDVVNYYKQFGKTFTLNRLLSDGWIEFYDNLYHITYQFIGALKKYYE